MKANMRFIVIHLAAIAGLLWITLSLFSTYHISSGPNYSETNTSALVSKSSVHSETSG